MKRDYWCASSKAVEYDGRMIRRGWGVIGFVVLLAFFLAFFAGLSHGQVTIGNAYRVYQFKGTTVGEKVTLAQNACSENTSIPCLIVFDPILAIFPTGNLPAKCSQCFWVDYRNPSALFGGGSGGVGSTANQQVLFNDNGSLAGSTCFLWNKTTNTFTVGCSGTSGIITLPGSASGTYVLKAANAAANAVGVIHDDGTGVVSSSLIVPADVATGSKQGNGSKFLMAGTVTANSPSLCTDSGGNATTTGCASSGGVAYLTQKTSFIMPATSGGTWYGESVSEINAAGTSQNPNGTRGVSNLYTTGTTINTNKGMGGNSVVAPHRAGYKIRFQHASSIDLGPAERRWWVGWSDAAAATLLGSDNPAGNIAAFWYCNDAAAGCDLDATNFYCVLKDNTTRNRIDSGVSVAANVRYGFEIAENPAGTWHFYINGAEVCGTGTTTNAPLAGTGMRVIDGIQNLSAVDRRLYVEGWQFWSDK